MVFPTTAKKSCSSPNPFFCKAQSKTNGKSESGSVALCINKTKQTNGESSEDTNSKKEMSLKEGKGKEEEGSSEEYLIVSASL